MNISKVPSVQASRLTIQSSVKLPVPGGTSAGISKRRLSLKSVMTRSGMSSDRLTQYREIPIVHVYDDTGKDVTPLPFEKKEIDALKHEASVLLGMVDTIPTADLIFADRTKTSRGIPSWMPSLISGESTFEDEDFIIPKMSFSRFLFSEQAQHVDESEEIIDEEEIVLPDSAVVVVTLTETDLVEHFTLESSVVSAESEEGTIVKLQNEKYKKLCKNKEANSDSYSNRPAQTFNFALKTKGIQTDPVVKCDISYQVTDWKLYDAEMDRKSEMLKEESLVENLSGYMEIKVLGTSSSESLSFIPHHATVFGETTGESDVESAKSSKSTAFIETILESDTTDSMQLPSFLKTEDARELFIIVDESLNLNIHQETLAYYKGLQALNRRIFEDAKDWSLLRSQQLPYKEIPLSEINYMYPNKYNLEILWTYYTPKLKGCAVNSLEWNPNNPDMLVVTYGQLSCMFEKHGYVCCWNPRNLNYPERMYLCTHGASTASFSTASPGLLAVGLRDGTVAVYNTSNTSTSRIIDNRDSSEMHIGTVWKVCWIKKPHDPDQSPSEILMSVCEDGRVCQWFVKKGMECLTIMRLKRHTGSSDDKSNWKKMEGLVATYSGGCCLQFHPHNPSIYIVGTEEGYIHLCSVTQSEQYLKTFTRHDAPVYKVEWSPYHPDLFISCSGDWTIGLWHQKHSNSLMILNSQQSEVLDIAWSPSSSTVFACVHINLVEIWDLNQTLVDPVTVYQPSNCKHFTTITFTPDGKCLVVGDREGYVHYLRLKNMPIVQEDQEKVLFSLIQDSMLTSIQQASPEDLESSSSSISLQTKSICP